MTTFRLLAVLSLLTATPAFGETIRQLDAHNHGEAQLTMVIDKDEIALTFHSPAANLIGFEHAPKTEEQQAQVDEAKATLGNLSDLFVFDGRAECESVEGAVHWTFDEHSGHAEGHDEHKEHEEHDDHKGHEHEGHEEHEEHHTATHSEFEAEFHVHCEQMDRLTSVDVGLFSLFPGLKELHVEALFTDSQFVDTLTPDYTVITVQ